MIAMGEMDSMLIKIIELGAYKKEAEGIIILVSMKKWKNKFWLMIK